MHGMNRIATTRDKHHPSHGDRQRYVRAVPAAENERVLARVHYAIATVVNQGQPAAWHDGKCHLLMLARLLFVLKRKPAGWNEGKCHLMRPAR